MGSYTTSTPFQAATRYACIDEKPSEKRYFLSTTFLARLLHDLHTHYIYMLLKIIRGALHIFLLSSCLLHLSFCIRICWSLVDSCKPHNRWTFRCIFWERVVKIKKWVMHTSVCTVWVYGQEMHISKWMWNRSKLIWCVLWGLASGKKVLHEPRRIQFHIKITIKLASW